MKNGAPRLYDKLRYKMDMDTLQDLREQSRIKEAKRIRAARKNIPERTGFLSSMTAKFRRALGRRTP